MPPVTSGHKINVHYLLKKCQLLDTVFKETLRLSNGATSARNIDVVTMIAGKKLHAGAKILIPYRQLHYDEDGCLGPFTPSILLDSYNLQKIVWPTVGSPPHLINCVIQDIDDIIPNHTALGYFLISKECE